jgi:hypothetical protein
LFVSKGIIEVHGGRIWAENNKDGKGSIFHFSRLPLHLAHRKANQSCVVTIVAVGSDSAIAYHLILQQKMLLLLKEKMIHKCKNISRGIFVVVAEFPKA